MIETKRGVLVFRTPFLVAGVEIHEGVSFVRKGAGELCKRLQVLSFEQSGTAK